ncbi:MAG TPA: putative toxin-antitoxin system toxin component, PIN family [Burkholderiales bacterium]|nr:putative toxin-antitoxin system toxin component, PIN family [Burkholderiales bacterium]
MILVLDTNVWLDWLLFDDPSVAPLKDAVKERRAEIFIDAACEAELVRVLAYDLGKRSIDARKQVACLAECRRIAKMLEKTELVPRLPRCADPADQIFLEAAAAARADYLVTKDRDLLDLARGRLPFRVVQPQFFET